MIETKNRIARSKTRLQLERLDISRATHWLDCKRLAGHETKFFVMDCVPLKKAKSGKLKVIVFGKKDFSGFDQIKRVRYVEPERVRLKD